jgi:hypothetical protein
MLYLAVIAASFIPASKFVFKHSRAFTLCSKDFQAPVIRL